MKWILLAIFFICFSAKAADYYISSSTGNNANPGTQAQPFQTLSKLNSVTLVAGDRVLLARGDTWNEVLPINQSGGSGNPITFSAYGSGAKPVITGFTTVSSWISLGNGVYESTSAISTLATCMMVTVNDTSKAMGRFPNAGTANGGYIAFQSHTGGGSTGNPITLTASGSPASPNFVGGDVVVRVNKFSIDRGVITGQATNSVTYTAPDGANPVNGFGFFFENSFNTLDQFGEWYYNPSTKKLDMFFGSATPGSFTVKATMIDALVTSSSKSNITLDNIDFEGANGNCITVSGGSNFIIQNCFVNYAGYMFVQSGAVATINNCSMNYAGNYGTTCFKVYNTIIDNVGIYPGMTSRSQVGDKGENEFNMTGISLKGDNGYARRCTVIGCGYIGIQQGGEGNHTDSSLVEWTGICKDDGGSIYMNDGSPSSHSAQRFITNNIVLFAQGSLDGTNSSVASHKGIYLDDNTSAVSVKYNSVANCKGSGFFWHNAFSDTLYGNTSYNNGVDAGNHGAFQTQHDGGGNDLTGDVIVKNIWFAKRNNLNTYYVFNATGAAIPQNVVDSNYYCRPIAETNDIRTNLNPGGTILRTLANWQTFSSQDAHSNITAQKTNDTNHIHFYFNATASSIVVPLNSNAVGVNGTHYSTSVILAPYTSIILMDTAFNPTTYYFANSGLFTNSCTTPTAPCPASRFVGLYSPADTFLFNRGDWFYVTVPPRSTTTSGTYITIDAYGTGNRPILTDYTVVNKTANWVLTATTNVWSVDLTSPLNVSGYTAVSGEAGNVGFLKVDGIIKGNKLSAISGLAQQWDFFSDGLTTLYVYSTQNPSNIYTAFLCSTGANGSNMIAASSYSNISNLEVMGSGGIGIKLAQRTNVTINNCFIHENGGCYLQSNTTRFGVGVEVIEGGNNIIVNNNTIRQSYEAALTMQSHGVSPISFTNVTFSNNITDSNECDFNPSIETGTPSSNGYVNCVVSGNTFQDAGTSWSHNVRPIDNQAVNIFNAFWNTTQTDLTIQNNIITNPLEGLYVLNGTATNPRFTTKNNTICINPNLYLVKPCSGCTQQYTYKLVDHAQFTTDLGYETGSTWSDLVNCGITPPPPSPQGQDPNDYILFELSTLVPAPPAGFFSQIEMTRTIPGDEFDEFYWFDAANTTLTKTGVSFPATGNYRFDVSGYKVAGSPQINVLVDGISVGSVTLSTTNTTILSVVANVAVGTHSVALKLANFNSGANTGRVGLIYYTQSSSPTPDVYPNIATLPLVNGQLLQANNFGSHNLRGFSLGSNGYNQSNANGGNVQATIDMVATKANIARCFVEIENPTGTLYQFKSGELEKLDSTILRAVRYKYYVLPCLFADPSLNTDYWGNATKKAQIAHLWATIALKYVGNPYVGGYDLINEPRQNFNYAEVIRFESQLIDTIRVYDNAHVVMVECIANDMFAMMLPLYQYTNVVYSPHGYSPLVITHQGVAGEPTANIRNTYPATVSTANLTAPFGITQLSLQHDDVRTMAHRFHVPICIGEFSCVNWSPTSTGTWGWTSTQWNADNISLLETEGWSWCYHAWRGDYPGWEAEIPSSYYNTFTFSNATPQGLPSYGTWVSNRSGTAPTITMLKTFFNSNAVVP